jgi:enoyl-CoA hydratase
MEEQVHSTTIMKHKFILTKEENGILMVTVNRPDKLNALNRETIREIGAAVEYGAGQPGVRVIILTGAGEKAFVAGADISEFAGFDGAQGEALAREGQKIFRAIEQCAKPVIAAVNGFALGGGCELAMACHIRIASEQARFGQPEVKLGLIPGYGGTQRMAWLAGRGKALEWLMTADMIDAPEAYRLGLVNQVVPAGELMDRCLETAGKIMKQAPLAVASVIRSVNAAFEPGVNGFETEAAEFGKCCDTSDFNEGTAAFLEKRKPVFKGK